MTLRKAWTTIGGFALVTLIYWIVCMVWVPSWWELPRSTVTDAVERVFFFAAGVLSARREMIS